MKYASIDIETTGLDPDTCQVLEVGVVLDDLDDQIDVKKLELFHCYVTHDILRGEPYALAMNAKILGRIASRESGFRYLKPEDVGGALIDFLEKSGCENPTVAAGKNFAAFDLQFLRRLPNFNSYVKFHHRYLDPATYYLRPRMTVPPNLNACLALAGLSYEVPHNAVDDARLVVRVLRAGFNKTN